MVWLILGIAVVNLAIGFAVAQAIGPVAVQSLLPRFRFKKAQHDSTAGEPSA
jgi:hypothetical protein